MSGRGRSSGRVHRSASAPSSRSVRAAWSRSLVTTPSSNTIAWEDIGRRAATSMRTPKRLARQDARRIAVAPETHARRDPRGGRNDRPGIPRLSPVRRRGARRAAGHAGPLQGRDDQPGPQLQGQGLRLPAPAWRDIPAARWSRPRRATSARAWRTRPERGVCRSWCLPPRRPALSRSSGCGRWERRCGWLDTTSTPPSRSRGRGPTVRATGSSRMAATPRSSQEQGRSPSSCSAGRSPSTPCSCPWAMGPLRPEWGPGSRPMRRPPA